MVVVIANGSQTRIYILLVFLPFVTTERFRDKIFSVFRLFKCVYVNRVHRCSKMKAKTAFDSKEELKQIKHRL